jgi:transposase
MAAGVLSMSTQERERSHLIRETQQHRVSQREASERLGIGLRQFKRLVRQWKRDGDAGLVSRQRGRASNNRLSGERRETLLSLLHGKYAGFGPTLAAEKLAEHEGIAVSKETIRHIQIAERLWRPKKRRAKRVHGLRDRRPRFGELIQIDGSPHAWLDDRSPRCTLIVFIDDATGRLTALRFAPSETRRAYLEALRSHVLEHGCPLAFYSDRHGIFRVNAKDAQSGDGKTEFGRVCERLKIDPIHALTPQAKGRVERANQTLQDRLVKEMRLLGIVTMEDAQAYAPTFIAMWNSKFAVEPKDPGSAHRPWTGTAEDLDLALASREERVLSKSLTFSWNGAMFCVKVKGPGTSMRGGKIEVLNYLDGRVRVLYKDRVLDCTPFKTLPRPSAAEDEKTIDARIDLLVAAAALGGGEGTAAGENVAHANPG